MGTSRKALWVCSGERACGCMVQRGLVDTQCREDLWVHGAERPCGYTVERRIVGTQGRQGLWNYSGFLCTTVGCSQES